MKRLALLLTWSLLIWTFGPQVLEAQETGTVQGRVVTETGQALSGAQVSIEGTELGGLTNTSGRYLILNVPAGEQTVVVQSMGYGTGQASVTVEAGEVTTQDFQMGTEAVALEELRISVGSRAAHTAADELPVPVDVYPEARLQAANAPDFLGTIEKIAPSIYVPQEQISDLASGLRPFQLRGMSPDQALVLINGTRRHQTASVAVFGSSLAGSSGIDMNAIPQMAIGQVEVLRDGASAQYGSDAIAGVLNLQLKNQVNPLTVQASVGKYFPDDFPNDGFRNSVSANWGFEFLGGVLNLTGEYARRNPTERAGADPRPQLICGDQPEDQQPASCAEDPAGDADVVGDIDGDGVQEVIEKRNPVDQPNHLVGDGFYENEMFFANYERPFDDVTYYLYGGASARTDLHPGFFRRANDDRNWPSIHPTGFLPTFDVDTRDLQATTGIRGEWNDWSYDVSGQFGQNRIDTDITNTHNASLGPCLNEACAPGRPSDGMASDGEPPPPNSRHFYAGSIQLSQYLGSFDATREFEVGMPSPLTLSVGTQLRRENYKIERGERGSYVNGFHPTQWGNEAASGAQVFAGFRPQDEADDSRTNLGIFAEGEVNLTDQILANAAARFETYSDFGQTVTTKLALRYQPVEQVIVRGSASTGFRAPTLGNINWTHVSTGFQTTPEGDQEAYEIGEFPVQSEEAQALGAPDVLQEESSVNFAGGIALTPFNNFNLTVDGYWIDVSDAIVLSGTIQGDLVEEILADAGSEATAVKYMTNAIDFQTRGLDVTANYRLLLAEQQFLEFSGSFNLNRVEVVDQVPMPDILQELDEQYMSRAEIDEFENEKPQEKGIASVLYSIGDLRANVQGNYFTGTTELINTNPDELQTFGSEFTLDAEMSYQFDNGLNLSVGAENLLDEYPGQTMEGYNFLGIFPWGTRIIGVNGRRLYTTVRYSFD